MTKRLFPAVCFLLCCFFLAVPPTVHPEFFSDIYGPPKQMDIVVGESKVIQVANPTRLAIGDPAIADVVGASNEEMLISAKAAGETNLQIWDDFGQREIVVRVFEEDLGKLQKRLKDLFATAGIKGVTFQIGTQERKVFVLGKVAMRKKEVVEQLLESFSEKIINLVTFKEYKPLVEIDIQILEISKAVMDKLGIVWTSSMTFTEANTPGAHTFLRHLADSTKLLGEWRLDRTTLTGTLNFLESDGMARTLARPKLVALSGKEAQFLVGGEIPIISSVSTTDNITTTSVEYVEYGISLKIKPEVKETGHIQSALEVEIKSVDTSTQLSVPAGGGSSAVTPGFKTRSASTELYLKDGQTIFLAGLISNDETNNLQQLPGLGNLPIIGALFRSKNFQIGATELVISITTKIVDYGDMRRDIQGAAIARAGVSGSEGDTAEGYTNTIQQIILGRVSYPLEAQRANLSGSVVLSLHILSDGRLVGVVVNESSGHKLLDGAAVFTVKRLAPYPSFPDDLTLKEIWVEIPIVYQLS